MGCWLTFIGHQREFNSKSRFVCLLINHLFLVREGTNQLELDIKCRMTKQRAQQRDQQRILGDLSDNVECWMMTPI